MGNWANPDAGLVAPNDIADLAGVRPSAVSNWRKRRPDFPKPAGGTVAKPLFNRITVERWLVAHGYQIQRDTGGLAGWALVNGFRDQVPLQLARALVLALLCARKLADGTPDMDELSHAASRVGVLDALHAIAGRPDSDPRWRDLVTANLESLINVYGARSVSRRTVDRLAGELFLVFVDIDVADLADVGDHVLQRVAATEGRKAGQHGAVGSDISRLLAQAGGGATGTAYDPACGIGEALLRLWQASPASDRLQLVGVDFDAEYVLVCKQRCFLYGAKATIECADVLQRDPDPGIFADVVVAEPPFGVAMPKGFSLTDPRWALAGPPPQNNSETAWLQHAITHLAPEGRAFVITGLGSTYVTGSARIRRSLVRSRCIEAVIALPPKLLKHTAIPTALWVLRSPDTLTPPNHVTFIDASQLDPSENFPVQAWLSQPEMNADERLPSCLRVAVEDVLADDQVNLGPRRWTQSAVDVNQIVERYHSAASEFDEAIDVLTQDAQLAIGRTAPASRTVSIHTLERQGALRILQTRTKRRRHSDADDAAENPWFVTTQMIEDGLPELPTGRPAPESDNSHPPDEGLVEVDDSYTEPGDVLVTTTRVIRAVVDETGGRMLRPGIIRLRMDQDQFEPRYVAACLTGSWNQRVETGAYTPHPRIRDLEIPLLPIDEQIRLADDVKQARRVTGAGRDIASAADKLITAQLDAIRFDVRLSDDAPSTDIRHSVRN